nr:hypothetical protein [uncultured Fusobacterium sp.]
MKGEFLLKIIDKFGEETQENLVGEVLGNLKNDLEEIKFILKNEKSNYIVELKQKELVLTRNAENKMLINLKFNGEKTTFLYEIENFKQDFLVLGEKFSYNDKDGVFKFSYTLFDMSHEEINKIEVQLKHLRCYN